MACFVKDVTVEGSDTMTSEIDLSTIALKPVQYTQTEIDALTEMTEGEVVWNSTTKLLNFYNGTVWAAI